jgi:hypothetical protein
LDMTAAFALQQLASLEAQETRYRAEGDRSDANS